MTANSVYVPKNVHDTRYNILVNQQKRGLLSAFDKVIGYRIEIRLPRRGAASDIDRASAIVQRFIVDYAASGFALLHHDNRESMDSHIQEDSITAERSAMLSRCYEEAKDVLRKNRAFVAKTRGGARRT